MTMLVLLSVMIARIYSFYLFTGAAKNPKRIYISNIQYITSLILTVLKNRYAKRKKDKKVNFQERVVLLSKKLLIKN